MVASWVVIIVMLVPVGGLEGSGYLGAAVLIVFAGLALGAWEAFAVAAATLGAGAAMALVLGGSPAVSSMPPSAAAAAWAAAATSYVLILLLVRVAVTDISRAVGSLHDELARREAIEVAYRGSQTRLSESLSLLRATLESTADGILVVNSSGGVVGHNQKFLDLWRIPPALVEAKDDDRLLAYVLHQLRDPGSFTRRVKELYDQPDAVSSDVLDFRDGRVYERYSQPQKRDGETVGRVWSFRDVTEASRSEESRRHLEVELFQAQKMEALGRLAGGIAHDFNNILTAIMSYSDLAKLDAAENPAVVESLDEVQRAGRRASELVNQILVFSRTRAQGRVPLRLGPVVEEAVHLLRSTLPAGVELTFTRALGEEHVLADPTQIHQVVMNLGINAGHALGETGGLIRVTLDPAEVDDSAFPAAPGLTPGRYMALAVSDDGEGMDQATLSRIYEPFFSTKAPGKGTGLGLAMVHSIVRTHQGAIAVESAPGAGSTFKVYFPVDLPSEPIRSSVAPG